MAEYDRASQRSASPPFNGIVLVLPGGGYEGLSPREGKDLADWLEEHGVAARVVPYPVSPHTHPVAFDVVLGAIADARATNDNPDARVVVLGSSAGGHLAGLVATASPAELSAAERRTGRAAGALSRPDAAAFSYPVVSFVNSAHLGSRRNLLGDRWIDHELALELSVELRIDRTSPPAFIWHTADDAVVPVRNALDLAAAFELQRVPFELHIFEGGPHGVGARSDDDLPLNEWPHLFIRWLAKPLTARLAETDD